MAQSKKKPELEVTMPARHKMVDDFEREYNDNLSEAYKAEAVTDEPAWQELYVAHRKAEIQNRAQLAESLKELAAGLKLREWDNDEEKAVKDTIKQAIAAKEAEQHWRTQTLTPLTDSARKAKDIWDRYHRQASNMANGQPMFGKQVLEDLKHAYRMLRTVTFDEQTGRITVHIPA